VSALVFPVPRDALGAPPKLANAEPAELGEIVVSADRQNEVDIQKSPLAISVVDTQSLTREGAQGFNDYLTGLPSVALQQSSPGQNQFVIRGMVTNAFNHTNLQDRALVSVYLDDTPISLQGNTPDLKIFDLQRIEVVRGPQGTLYGAGAMAGNIRFVTVKPSTSKFEASGEATVADTAHGGADYSVRGVFNLPLSETLALRINAYRGGDSGYIDNIGLNETDANSDNQTQARAVLRWKPVDELVVDLSHTFARLRSNGDPTLWRTVLADTTPLGPAIGTGPFETNNTNIPEHYNDDFNLTNLTMAYSFEPADLISSTSYVHRNFERITSGQYLVGRRGLGLNTVPYDSIMSSNNIQNTLRDFSQELRLQSRNAEHFSWITGLFFEHDTRTQVQDIPTVGFDQNAYGGFYFDNGFTSTSPQVGAPHPDDPFYGNQDIRERQIAVFGEATYEFLPGLKLTGGARYFHWHQDFDLYFAGLLGAAFNPAGFPSSPLVRGGVAGSESGTNPRAALSYQVTDRMLVFTEAAKGFRFGGVNQPIPQTCGVQSPDTFGSDSAWTYQVGEKSSFFDDRTTLNLTAFLTNWSDVQTSKLISQCSYFFIVNDGHIRTKGVELESRSRLTDQLLFTINASYTDAESNGPIPNLGVLDGAKAPLVPRYEGSASVDYAVPVGVATIDLHADFQFRDGFYESWVVDPTTAFDPSFTRLDLAANYVSGGPWEAGVYIRNVADRPEIYSVGSRQRRSPPSYPNFQTEEIGPGRIVGIRFHYSFR
jgi:iron complex outermembrane receptor protein